MKFRAPWTCRCRSAVSCLALPLILLLITVASDAVAAEGSAGWRPTYDLIMRWVNFIILALLLVKLARLPLSNFIRSRQIAIGSEIEELETQRQAAETAIKEAEAQLAESNARLETIKERIVEQGQSRKAEIIASAQKEGEMMLAAARIKVDNQLQSAKDQLRAEMVDLAVEQALRRLPGLITKEDNQRLVEEYMAAAQTK